MKNRNYFLVNCYSRDDYFELLRYFEANKIPAEDKTKFMPQAQKSAIFFEDKHEVWSDDANDTQIPKDDWKRKIRRFLVWSSSGRGGACCVLALNPLKCAVFKRVGNRRGEIKSTKQ